MVTPACRIDHCTRPEQSKMNGPAPPHTYGSPTLLSAAVRNRTSLAVGRPTPWLAGMSIAPAAPLLTTDPDVITWVTSAATAVPAGASFLIRAVSRSSLACGALITIAFDRGRPSDEATLRDMTSPTPPIPTVPKPATGSVSFLAPMTVTGWDRVSRSSVPIVYEIA